MEESVNDEWNLNLAQYNELLIPRPIAIKIMLPPIEINHMLCTFGMGIICTLYSLLKTS